jgi:hypothetical protein
MKKIALILSILMLCATFAVANYAAVEFLGKSGDYKVTFDRSVKAGWNLLPADRGSWSLSSDMPEETFLQKIKAYYVYLPVGNKYVDALSGFNQQDQASVQTNKNYLETSAGWYYFSSDVTLSYVVEDGGVMPKLHSGWNLISVNPMMTELNSQVSAFPKGNCVIAKAYMWDNVEKMWESIGETNSIHNSLDIFVEDETVGVGLALKVKSSCQLGLNGENAVAPPTLPS